jgi:hypothetical protein
MKSFIFRGTLVYAGPKSEVAATLKEHPEIEAVYSLIKVNEGANAIGSLALDNDCSWRWYPTTSFSIEYKSHKYNHIVADIVRHIDSGGGPILIHCSKGIHRTCSAILNVFGHYDLSRNEAASLIMKCRPDVPWGKISIF